jgi:choline kinase
MGTPYTNILLATPAYGGNVCARYTESLVQTCELLKSMNIKYTLKFINNQLVTRARNMLCHLFMKDERFTHMMFLDADVVWNPVDIVKLITHEKECVIGVYPNKMYYWENDKLILYSSSKLLPHKRSGELIEVERAATGFMLLTKPALKRIEKDIDTFKLPSGPDIETLYNYFDCNVVDHDYLTEDYYFSYLFLKNGGKIYADTSITLLHIGNHEYGVLLK